MIDNLKDKINKISISLQLMESVNNELHNLIITCQIIKPQYDFLNTDFEYTVETPIFNYQELHKEFVNIFTPFSEIYFDNKRYINISELERQYITDVSNYLHGKGQETENFIIGLFTIYQNSQIKGLEYVTTEKVNSLLENIIIVLSKLKKLKDLEIKKIDSSKEYNTMSNEIIILNECLIFTQKLFDYIQKTIITKSLKSQINILDEKIKLITQNEYLKIYNNSIKDNLKNLKNSIENNSIPIRIIHRLINLFDQEICEALKRKNEEENILLEMSKYLESNAQKRNSQNNNQKMKEFQEDSYIAKNITKVYSEARNPNTAIRHVEKGKELQMYFISQQAKEFIDSIDDEKLDNENINKKANINSWYKYGSENKDNTKKITNLKTTNFGISVKDLLKESGIDQDIFYNFKKD